MNKPRNTATMLCMGNKRKLTKDAVSRIVEGYGSDPGQLLAVLLDIQAASGRNYVDREWAEFVSVLMNLPLSKVFDVLTFYAMLSTEPRGEYLVEICQSAPCRFCGGSDVADWFEAAAGIKMGQTTPDGKITLTGTSCIGACEIGPAVKIGENVFGNLDREKAGDIVRRCLEGDLPDSGGSGNPREVPPCQN